MVSLPFNYTSWQQFRLAMIRYIGIDPVEQEVTIAYVNQENSEVDYHTIILEIIDGELQPKLRDQQVNPGDVPS